MLNSSGLTVLYITSKYNCTENQNFNFKCNQINPLCRGDSSHCHTVSKFAVSIMSDTSKKNHPLWKSYSQA